MKNNSLVSRKLSGPVAGPPERNILLCAGLLLVLIMGCATQTRGQGASAQKVLHNEEIVSLTRAGLSDAAIISLIRTSRTEFDLSPEALVSLRQAGVSNAVIETMLGSPMSAVPRTTIAPNPLPTVYGYYVAEGGQLRSIQTVPIRIVFGLKVGDRGIAVDGVAGEPNFSLKDPSPTFIVYQQSVDIQSIHFSSLTFVSSMKAYEFDSTGIRPEWFRSITGRDYYESIPINLWRPENEVLFNIEPVEGKSGMFKLTPKVALKPGRYVSFFGKTMHRNGMIFGSGGDSHSALYFEVVERSPTAGTRTTSGTIRPPVAQPPAVSTAACGDYDSCLKGGNEAFLASQWDQALAYFQKASGLELTKPDAWVGLGRAYLASAQYREVPAAWDRALVQGGQVTFSVCHEHGLASCTVGDFTLGVKQVSFTAGNGQKLFSVAPSEIQIEKTFDRRNLGNTYFRLKVGGKNYNFDFLPFGVTCQTSTLVRCPDQGFAQQSVVANYVLQTIPKLASGQFAKKEPPAPAPAVPQSSRSESTATEGCPTKFANRIVPDGCLGEFRHGTPVKEVVDSNGKKTLTAAIPATATNTHPGIDIVAECGSLIYPLTVGEVVDLITDSKDPDFPYLGYMVMLRHDSPTGAGLPTYTLYLHMQASPEVRLYQRVSSGTPLGGVGRTGVATSCHTHFEIRHFPTRYFEECLWNFPSNIYGQGYLPNSVAFQENWENPETVIADNSRLPDRPRPSREVVLADLLYRSDDSNYVLAPFLVYAGGTYTTLPDGTASVATAKLVPQDFSATGAGDPNSPRVAAAKTQSILNKIKSFDVFRKGRRVGCFSVTEVDVCGNCGGGKIIGKGISIGSQPQFGDIAVVGPASHAGFWTSAAISPAEQKQLLSQALAMFPKTVPSNEETDLPVGKPVIIGQTRVSAHVLDFARNGKTKIFFNVNAEMKTALGPFASGDISLLESHDERSGSPSRLLDCRYSFVLQNTWRKGGCWLMDVVDIDGDGVAELILRRVYGEVGDIEIYEPSAEQLRLIAAIRGWTGS